jgi:hypothetical protein
MVWSALGLKLEGREMPQRRWATKRDAFAHYNGAKADNPVWGWSAISEDGKTVVVALWDDRFNSSGDYSDLFREGDPDWSSKPGNLSRAKHLRHAKERCDGLFRVVRVRARDPKAKPRAIAEHWTDDTLVMRLAELRPSGAIWATPA